MRALGVSMIVSLVLPLLLAGPACGARGGKGASQPGPDDPALLTAARHVCSLVAHEDDGVVAVAFARDFFDDTPRSKLHDMIEDIKGALGACTEKMAIADR